MTDLQTDIRVAVEAEYARASAIHGPTFHSAHEGYAVILEEFEEAQTEDRAFEWNLRSWWNMIRANTPTKCQLQQCRRIAEAAAAEWTQVAAMCLKAERSMEK